MGSERKDEHQEALATSAKAIDPAQDARAETKRHSAV
jgi:hypothetical protein